MANPAQRHLRYFFGLVVAGLALTAALNALVNPWRVLPEKTEIKALDPYRDVDAEIRTCKAGLAIRGPWEILVIGSSRPGTGMNPDGPAFSGRPTVNLGMNGGDLYETRAMLDHALTRQSPKLAILMVDPGDLTRPGKIQIENDFEFSPLSKGDPVERSLRYVFSQMSVDASVAALKLVATKGKPAYGQTGLQHREAARLNFFETMENFYLKWVGVMVGLQKRNLGIQADKIETIRGMLEHCVAKGVQPILVIPPNHLSVTQVMEEKQSPDPWFLAERRAMAKLVADVNTAHPQVSCVLWDLNIPSPVTTEPYPPRDQPRPMMYWLDPIHFTPATGDRYASLILGTGEQDKSLALKVDVNQPDAYLAEVERLFKDAQGLLKDEREGIRRVIAAEPPAKP